MSIELLIDGRSYDAMPDVGRERVIAGQVPLNIGEWLTAGSLPAGKSMSIRSVSTNLQASARGSQLFR
jgi:hypothetical protein